MATPLHPLELLCLPLSPPLSRQVFNQASSFLSEKVSSRKAIKEIKFNIRTSSLPDNWKEIFTSTMELPSEAQPPSDEEARNYYYGLPSRPKLVARSTTTPWRLQADHWPIGKFLLPIGRHAIVDMWTGPLLEEILECLEGISWTGVDILRIGYERRNEFSGEEFPRLATLLISVEPSSTSWRTGYTAVCACKRILESHGISDVDVEMKEGQLRRCASPPTPTAPPNAPKLSSRPLSDPAEMSALFSEFTGVSIAAYDQPECEGTKCLYLRSRDGQKVFALTCRHVALGEASEDYRHDANDPRMVIQPGTSTLNDLGRRSKNK